MIQAYNDPLSFEDGGWLDPKMAPPGTDTIPAVAQGIPLQLDGGEFIMPRDTTEQLGPEFLQNLVDQTHAPQRKKGGMADGGSLEDYLGMILGGALGGGVGSQFGGLGAAGYADGGWLQGLFSGMVPDRGAQIDAAVDGAVNPPVPPPAPVQPVEDTSGSDAMLRDFMRDIRAQPQGYAGGGLVPIAAKAMQGAPEAANGVPDWLKYLLLGAGGGAAATTGAAAFDDRFPDANGGPMGQYQDMPGFQSPGYADGGWLSGMFEGLVPDRQQQIDDAVNQAVNGPSPVSLPDPMPAAEEDPDAGAKAMMRDFMRDVRAGYADGGMIPMYSKPLGL